MEGRAKILIKLLMELRGRYGDLNRALVMLYLEAYGEASERQIAQDLGVSRSLVRRCLLGWSEKDH